jgi:hypothetical protein
MSALRRCRRLNDCEVVAMSERNQGEVQQPKRRAFLKGALVVGAGTAVAVVTDGGGAVRPAEAAGPTPGPAQTGYQETDHVRDYYRTARL